MNIDKSKLKLGIWYEDESGNVTKIPDDMCIDRLPEEAKTYHSCFPLQVTDHVRIVHNNRGGRFMKVWITKYALTRGIFEMEVKSTSRDGSTVYGNAWDEAYGSRDWYKRKTDAVKRAKEMRKREITRLENKIKKLKEKRFE